MRRVLIAFIIAFIAGRAAASFPLEEQRVAAAMQARLQDSLDRLFGAGRSAAAISVALATDPRVARRIDEALGGAALGPSGRYEWTWETIPSALKGRYVLPGLPDPTPAAVRDNGLSIESAAALAKRTSRLSITVLLDETLPPDADGRATELVARTVELNQARGDLLEVSRAPIPRPAPPAGGPVSSIFLWCCLLVAAAATAVLFWLADRWMRRPPPPREEPRALPAPPPPKEPPPPLPDDVLSRVRAPFQIRSEDASKLFFLLRKESSEDIALVLPHLIPETRKALLAYFSEEEAARAIEASTRFRVVDPELIVLLKAELERRVSALHGGPDVTAALLDDADPQDKARILAALERFEPQLAATLKGGPPGDAQQPFESGGGGGPFPDGSGSPPTPQLFLDEDPR